MVELNNVRGIACVMSEDFVVNVYENSENMGKCHLLHSTINNKHRKGSIQNLWRFGF